MKRVLLMGLAILALGISVAFAGFDAVSAAPKDEICKGVAITGGSCDEDPETGGLDAAIKNIINIFSILVGTIAVIMIMVSGAKYINSGGDSGKVKSAKDTLIYAIIGIVIVALSQFIVQFVLKNAETPKKEETEESSLSLPVAQAKHIENYYTVVL